MTKTKLLTGASALVAASLAFASAAHAVGGPGTNIYGGGSSLIAPDMRNVGDCYGNQVPLVIIGTVLTGPTANETASTLPFFNFTGVPAHNCAAGPVDAGKTANYISTGSGAGINGYYSHDAATFWGDTVPGTTPSPYPAVSFAASDYGLNGTDAGVYANGGTEGSVTVVAPGVTPVAPQYGNPAQLYGAQIQIPVLVSPVALPYDPVYKKAADGSGVVTSYKFHLKKLNVDGSGGLILDVSTVCAIFNGQITLWNDPALKALNGGVSLKDTTDTGTEFATLPIEIVGRADSSGTTSIFYRALAAQCGQGANGSTYTEGGHNITYTNAYLPAGSKKTPPSLQGATYAGGVNNGPAGTYTQLGQVGKYTLANLSSGVADYVAFNTTPAASTTYVQGRLGFLSPDYALPAVINSGANTYGLNVVDVKVGTTVIEPTGANALKAFGSANAGTAILPPQSNSTGGYTPATTNVGLRSAPQDWAEPLSTTLTYSNAGAPVATPLANPTLLGSFYPFVGTTNVSLYTCYSNSATAAAIRGFFNYYLNDKTVATATTGLLAKNGFSPMPKAWTTAITQTFITPTKTGTPPIAPTNALNLNILNKGALPATGTGSQCNAITVGA